MEEAANVTAKKGAGGTVTGSARPSEGVIAGAVLRAARRTAGLTQESAAELLGTDLGTIKGWETGRRPLGRVQARRLAQIARQLREAGARTSLLRLLHMAIDADDFTAATIDGDCSRLADEVITRPWTALVAWAARGDPIVEARDATPAHPLLPAQSRKAFFETVRKAAAQFTGDEDATLLRRQAYYLAAWDDTPDGAGWLHDAERREVAQLRLSGKWNPGWPVARSLAVARSCQGDPEPLRWFVSRELSDDVCDSANLAYWAYWIGCDSELASSDEFMAEHELDVRQAATLLRHLAQELSRDVPYVDLSVYAVRSLAYHWPDLLRCAPEVAAELAVKTGRMLDEGHDFTPQTRQRLSDINFAASMVRGPMKGN